MTHTLQLGRIVVAGAIITSLAFVLPFVVLAQDMYEAEGNGNVAVHSTNLPKIVVRGESDRAVVRLISNDGINANNVDVLLSLVNKSTGEVVAKERYEGVDILHEAPQAYGIGTKDLKVGEYKLKVVVRNDDGSLNKKFNNVGRVTVIPRP